MKKSIIIALLCLIGAILFIVYHPIAKAFPESKQQPVTNKTVTGSDGRKYSVITIDGCEYITYHIGSNNGMMTHKGNCKYCCQYN